MLEDGLIFSCEFLGGLLNPARLVVVIGGEFLLLVIQVIVGFLLCFAEAEFGVLCFKNNLS